MNEKEFSEVCMSICAPIVAKRLEESLQIIKKINSIIEEETEE